MRTAKTATNARPSQVVVVMAASPENPTSTGNVALRGRWTVWIHRQLLVKRTCRQDRPVHATTPAFNNREYLAGEQPAQPLANEVPRCRLKFFSGQPHSCLPNSDISEHWDAETNINLYPRASPSLRLLRGTLASFHHKGGFATRRLVSIAEC